jgi:dolichyl-phosphate-mannose--protein O-mannosyl transferase
MTKHQGRPHAVESTGQRWADACIGALLVGCAVAILALFPLSDWTAMLAMIVLLLLGIDALRAAWKARPSLLSRIGPLP